MPFACIGTTWQAPHRPWRYKATKARDHPIMHANPPFKLGLTGSIGVSGTTQWLQTTIQLQQAWGKPLSPTCLLSRDAQCLTPTTQCTQCTGPVGLLCKQCAKSSQRPSVPMEVRRSDTAILASHPTTPGVDRAALAAQVIGTPEALKTLEGIIHPLVRAARDAMVAAATSDVVVFDIPLLFETDAASEVGGGESSNQK